MSTVILRLMAGIMRHGSAGATLAEAGTRNGDIPATISQCFFTGRLGRPAGSKSRTAGATAVIKSPFERGN
jgi:hypothetical protein